MVDELISQYGFTEAPLIPSLSAGQRGLILTPFTDAGPVDYIGLGSKFDKQAALTALYFWDAIVWPDTGMAMRLPTDDADLQFLVDEGLLSKSLVYIGVPPEPHAAIHRRYTWSAELVTFLAAELKDPGRWIVSSKRTRTANDYGIESGRGMIAKLHGAIPLPANDVAFEDLLSFKERRSSELLALRSHIDEIYNSLVLSPDRPLSEVKVFDEIEKSCADLLSVSREAGLKMRFSDLSLEISFDQLAAPLISVIGATKIGFSTLEAMGAAAAAFSISVGAGLRHGKVSGPFSYVARVHKELRRS